MSLGVVFGCVPPIVEYEADGPILRVSGDEDRTTQALRRCALSRAMQNVKGDVVVDLTGLHFADSSLMVDLAVLAQRLRARGQHVRLRGAQPQISTLIEMMGLHRLPAVSVEI